MNEGIHVKIRFVDIVVNVNARAKGEAVFFHHILATPPKCTLTRCTPTRCITGRGQGMGVGGVGL